MTNNMKKLIFTLLVIVLLSGCETAEDIRKRECTKDMGCEYYNCLSEHRHFVNQATLSQKQYQNCLLKEVIESGKYNLIPRAND